MLKWGFSFFLVFSSLLVQAQTAVLPVYACTLPGTQALVSGMKSTNYQMGVIRSCTVTVYLTGTTTLATSSPQSPFTANTNGSIPPIYVAVNRGYDVVLSGGISPNTYPSPVTLTGLYPGSSFSGGFPAGCSFATSLGIPCGGTGASTAAGALSNLGGAALAGATFTGPIAITPGTGLAALTTTTTNAPGITANSTHTTTSMGLPEYTGTFNGILSANNARIYALQVSATATAGYTGNHAVAGIFGVTCADNTVCSQGAFGVVASQDSPVNYTGLPFVPGYGLRAETQTPGVLWQYGLGTTDGGAYFGASLGASCTSGTCGSQPLVLQTKINGTNYLSQIQTDTTNDIILIPGTTGGVQGSVVAQGGLNVTGGSLYLSPNGTGTGLNSQPITLQYGSSSSPSMVSIVADSTGLLHFPSSLFAGLSSGGYFYAQPISPTAASSASNHLVAQYRTGSTTYPVDTYVDATGNQIINAGAGGAILLQAQTNVNGPLLLSVNGTGTGLSSNAVAFNYGNSASPSVLSVYAGSDGILRLPNSLVPGLSVNGQEYILPLAGTTANSNYLTFQNTLSSTTQVLNLWSDATNNYLHTDRSFVAPGYYINNAGTAYSVIPNSVIGYNGNASGVKLPLALTWATPSAITSVCHDASGNLTDASCTYTSGTVTSIDGSASEGAETAVSGTVAAITSSGIVRGAFPYISASGGITLSEANRGHLIISNDASDDVYALPTPSGANFQNGWYAEIKNISATNKITLTPAGSTTIDGAATLVVPSHTAIKIESDGANYHSTMISPVSLNTQGLVYASPASGSGPPNMRALVATDIPSLSYQAPLSLVAGTYADGKMCTYATSGTLLNCNTTIPTVGTWGALNYPSWSSGTPFVKMTAAGAFALDTNTYANLTGAAFTGAISVVGGIQANAQGTATSISGNYSSYNFQMLGSYWNGTVAAGDTWFMNNVLGTGTEPTSTLYIQHIGSSGVATVSVPSLTIGAGTTVTAFGTSANNALQLDSGGKVPVANLPAPTTTVSSGAISVSGISNYVACTTTCTVTPITPAPGVQLCVRNAPGSATVITLAAQSGIYYELTTHAGWGTVNHTLVSGGVATDQICLVGYDATHYMVMSFTGTWTD